MTHSVSAHEGGSPSRAKGDMGKNVLLCVPWELGGSTSGGGEGATRLCSAWAEHLMIGRKDISVARITRGPTGGSHKYLPSSREGRLLSFEHACSSLEGQVPKIVEDQHLWCFTADHSLVVALIAELVRIHPGERWGLIWIDAHADINTPCTTTTGNLHGMSLAALLGIHANTLGTFQTINHEMDIWERCLNGFIQRPLIAREDLVAIGVRDIAPLEKSLMSHLFVKTIEVSEIHSVPGTTLAGRLLSELSRCTQVVLSFDIDAVDANEMPGSASPSWFGASFAKMNELFRALSREIDLRTIEITEYNPKRDPDNRGLKMAVKLLSSLNWRENS